ncbi:MAG TPA: universal stress protein [Thermomicrobiales bacterium]|nr:universal stress protein [Thermomicrobiales bacterium]
MVSLRQAFRPVQSDRNIPISRRILVPVSGAESDQRLLTLVEKIARKQNAFVTIVYVVEVQQSMPLDAELPAEIERGEQVLRDAEKLGLTCVDGKTSMLSTELLQARSAGAAIVDEAIDRNADVIMMGATIRKKYGKATIGETVDYVLKNAPCEVFIIRPAMPDWVTEGLEHE